MSDPIDLDALQPSDDDAADIAELALSPEGAVTPYKRKTQKILKKEIGAELLRQLVLRRLKPMVEKQVAHAMGIGHVYTRDKHGRFTKIENEQEVERLLSEGTENEHYYIFTKDPSTAAFTDLMNRALGKPVEAQEVTHSGGITVKWQE